MIDLQATTLHPIVSTPTTTLRQYRSQQHLHYRLHLAALLFFVVMTFLILYPLIFHNGTLIAGYDYFNYHWNLWWIRHALTTPGLNVYETNFVMFPHMNNLGYHALTAFWYPLWAILEPLVGTLTAMNVVLCIGCVLNGYLLFVLLLSEEVAPGLALLGGAVLQLSPVVRYFLYNTHINLFDWFWLPAHLLLWKQIVTAVTARRLGRAVGWAVVQGIAIWGLGLTDLQFPIFVGFLLIPYGLLTVWRSKYRMRLISLGLIAVTVGLLLLWFVGPLPYMRQFTGTLAPGSVEDRPGIPFPSGYLTLYPVWWNWDTPTLGGFVTIATLLTLAVSLPPLRRRIQRAAPTANVAARPAPTLHDRWFWFALIIPPFILTMGPTLTLGSTAIPLPFRWLYALTGGNFRMPWRLAPIFIIAAVIFMGKTWTPLLNRLKATFRPLAVAVVFCLLGLDVRMFQTGPLQPVLQPYQFYQKMGQEQGKPYNDYVVLEVPTGAGTGEVLLNARVIPFQFYGMVHGKRMVNGFISRAPVENFWPMRTDDPLLSWLGQRRFLDPKLVEAELRKIIYEWPIGYIVIHEDYIGPDGPIPQEIIGYFNTLPDLVCPVWVEGHAIVYRTVWHPDGCPARTPPEITPGVYQIKLGETGDERYIGWGWYWQEAVPGDIVRWTGAYPQAKLYVDLPAGAYQLSLSTQAYHRARQLAVQINGVSVGSSIVPVEGLQTLTFEVPAAAIGDGKHVTVSLNYDSADSPADLGIGADQRKLAIMVDWVRFARKS